jgi:protein-S-isoprenylcysteine O-methyltransferase Ste14/rhodanese-related sulfurtransferase
LGNPLLEATPISEIERNYLPSRWLQWLEEYQALTIAAYVLAVGVIGAVWAQTGFVDRDLSPIETALVVLAAIPSGFLLVFSLTELITYFVFIPSISKDGHLFARVHGAHLIHPLTTAVVLALFALCVFTGAGAAWALWVCLLAVHTLHTALIVRKIRSEHLMYSENGHEPGLFFTVLSLVIGGEIVTVAAGAKPLAPWRLSALPENTWIVDVRTKSEFSWNRLQAAENFPWGAGVIEAAAGKSKDDPVLVTCLSGHRSPAVAVMLRKLGFKTVYNLNWGILYLILIDRGRKTTGPFSLTRAHREADMRGPDFRAISIGYITFAVLTLIAAPIDNAVRHAQVSAAQQIVGALFGFGGLLLGFLSFRALGRNFRVFAAPRRSGTLITTGVYSKVRHPMYTSVVMALLGYVMCFGSVFALPFWLCCAILYVAKAAKEEPLLMQRYEEYEEYRKRTWKFLPYIW